MAGASAEPLVPSPALKGRARAVLNRLRKLYPSIGTALDYTNPWQLLVVTVLSAQTTDETVNRVAPVLFKRYPEPADLAQADPRVVEEIIFSTGFYHQKAKSIIALATVIDEQFGGEVPDDIDSLVELPGVGRKTASVVLAEAWDLPAIAVDTHVRRVTRRLGLTQETDPARIEVDLKSLYPKRQWSGLSMRFIQFGRDVCEARRPACHRCPLFDLCAWPDRFRFADQGALG